MQWQQWGVRRKNDYDADDKLVTTSPTTAYENTTEPMTSPQEVTKQTFEYCWIVMLCTIRRSCEWTLLTRSPNVHL